jgi:CheY-like chemotaxis protein
MSSLPTILIVEDDAGTRHLLEVIVRRNDCHPVAVVDGKAALQALESVDFDLVLLDLLLPKLDGREILRRISLATPHLLRRIIVVTALAPAEYLECEAISAVWSILRKPFELSLLEKQMLACRAECAREAERVAALSPSPARNS